MRIKKKIQKVLDLFAQISAIPRQSKNEAGIRNWLVQWASDNGFSTNIDRVGNLLIRVPAKPGYEKAKPVILQAHLDMVCEKTPDSTHDFSKDPIKLVYDGEWLKAEKTSLGADNGIGIALAMAIATDPKVGHPPLELLFTVEEEIGLNGASGIEPGFLEGRILINLDSEDEGKFTIGCAGGRDSHVSLPLIYEEVPEGYRPFCINAEGMIGGHSGINIHEGRANAIIVVGRVLMALAKEIPLRLTFISGGTAHNAIPRFCSANIFLPNDQCTKAEQIVCQMEKILRTEYSKTDPNIKLSISEITTPDRRAMTEEVSNKVLNLIIAFPHGVAAMSQEIPGLVETSNNLAKILIESGELRIVSSQRSAVMSRLTAMTEKIEAIAAIAGASCYSNTGYPSWEPNTKSSLLERCRGIYKKMFRKEPHVEIIHAGLECGIIGAKFPGMDMISFGATIRDPHSTQERLEIESVGKTFDFLAGVLESME